MKKFLSFLLSALMIASVAVVGRIPAAAEAKEEKTLQSFIDGITELAREYDADKDFVVSEPEKTDTAQAFSATQNDFAASASMQNTEENSGDSTEPAAPTEILTISAHWKMSAASRTFIFYNMKVPKRL